MPEVNRLPGRQIRSVQALRALAALFVVGFHATVLWHDKFNPATTPWQNGNSGVDLFFVISGFIMIFLSQKLLGQPGSWAGFLKLRLVRIVPLYWLMTAAKLVSIALVPAMALHTRPTSWNIIASFLFIPSADATGNIRPVLEVGWTLSFEMLFYLLFAAGLFATTRLAWVVGGALLAMVALAATRTPAWPAFTVVADPLLLEFLFGVLVGKAFLSAKSNPTALVWIVLLVAGIAVLAFAPMGGRWQRTLVWGLAATATVHAAVMSEPWIGPRLPDWCVAIGEASYSMYLTQGFVLPLAALTLLKLHLQTQVPQLAFVLLCLTASTAVALVSYKLIELPMTTYLRRKITRPTNVPVPTLKSPA